MRVIGCSEDEARKGRQTGREEGGKDDAGRRRGKEDER